MEGGLWRVQANAAVDGELTVAIGDYGVNYPALADQQIDQHMEVDTHGRPVHCEVLVKSGRFTHIRIYRIPADGKPPTTDDYFRWLPDDGQWILDTVDASPAVARLTPWVNGQWAVKRWGKKIEAPCDLGEWSFAPSADICQGGLHNIGLLGVLQKLAAAKLEPRFITWHASMRHRADSPVMTLFEWLADIGPDLVAAQMVSPDLRLFHLATTGGALIGNPYSEWVLLDVGGADVAVISALTPAPGRGVASAWTADDVDVESYSPIRTRRGQYVVVPTGLTRIMWG